MSAVAILAFAGGYSTGHSIVRMFAVWIGGLVFIAAVFFLAMVLPNPVGDGWANQTLLYGHWVPDWEWMLSFWAFVAWWIADWVGIVTRGATLEWSRHRAR